MILKKHFFFVRHAETSWNHQKLCQGQKDVPLNEKSLLAAQTFALETQNASITCIVSSPLSRALQTAKEIYRIHPSAQFHIIAELAERGWGALEGMSNEEMYAIERSEEKNPFHTSGKGIEQRPAFRTRVFRGILEAQKISPHPLIVSHGRVFMELCQLLGLPLIRQLPNCQFVKIVPTSEGWSVNIQKCCAPNAPKM